MPVRENQTFKIEKFFNSIWIKDFSLYSHSHKSETGTQTPDLNMQLLINNNFKPLNPVKGRNRIATNPRMRNVSLSKPA